MGFYARGKRCLKARHVIAQRRRPLRRQRHALCVLNHSGQFLRQTARRREQLIDRQQRLDRSRQHREQRDSRNSSDAIRATSKVPGSIRLATQNKLRPSTCLR